MAMKKSVVAVLGLSLLLGWGIYDVMNKPDSKQQESVMEDKDRITGLQEGNLAPSFELLTLNGEKANLSELKGKKVILNFWATWCPPCKAEMPHMEEFYKEQRDNGVEILAVNLTNTEKTSKDVESFVASYGLTFPILLDEDGSVGQEYQAVSIPTSYIIDQKGVIRTKIVGPMDKDTMNELISNLE